MVVKKVAVGQVMEEEVDEEEEKKERWRLVGNEKKEVVKEGAEAAGN